MSQPREERRGVLANVLDELKTIAVRQESIAAKQEALGLSFAELKSGMMTRAEIESALDRRLSVEAGLGLQKQIDELKKRPDDTRSQLSLVIAGMAGFIAFIGLLSQHWH